jgi:HlyD family secretion protein
MNTNVRRVVAAVFAIALIGAAAFYFARMRQGEKGPLQASGTVEAEEIVIAFQLGGQVAEVAVQEGQRVQQGDLLVRFEDQILQAQRKQAERSLAQAEASYALVAAQPLEEQQKLAVASAKMELIAAQQVLADLWEGAEVARAQAELDLAQARQAEDDAQDTWDRNQPGNRAKPYTIKEARANVTIAKKRLDRAQRFYDAVHGKIPKAKAQIALSEAHRAYDRAVWLLDWLKSGADPLEQGILDAQLALAKENVTFMESELEKVSHGPNEDELRAAQARLERAQAQLAVAMADTTQQQLDQAQAGVDSARAALEVILSQIDKLELAAPSDGVVLYRAVDPGDVVMPGAPAITLGRLQALTITVYIPENQYGQIRLGQGAAVTVDSFPGTRFEAHVTRIADQAEFTPRNVQTPEGRQTTVFAVDLSVVDGSGRLKPGMPADVVFQG